MKGLGNPSLVMAISDCFQQLIFLQAVSQSVDRDPTSFLFVFVLTVFKKNLFPASGG